MTGLCLSEDKGPTESNLEQFTTMGAAPGTQAVDKARALIFALVEKIAGIEPVGSRDSAKAQFALQDMSKGMTPVQQSETYSYLLRLFEVDFGEDACWTDILAQVDSARDGCPFALPVLPARLVSKLPPLSCGAPH